MSAMAKQGEPSPRLDKPAKSKGRSEVVRRVCGGDGRTSVLLKRSSFVQPLRQDDGLTQAFRPGWDSGTFCCVQEWKSCGCSVGDAIERMQSCNEKQVADRDIYHAHHQSTIELLTRVHAASDGGFCPLSGSC